MRVAIVAESFLPSINGVARSVERIVHHLDARGHEVLIVAPGPGSARHGRWPVVRLRSLPLPMCRDFPVGIPSARIGWALEHFRPDVVHLASPTLVGAAGAAQADKLGIPTVAVFQTDVAGFATQYIETLRPGTAPQQIERVTAPIWRWLRRIHERADVTLAPSRHTMLDLRRHGMPRVERWARGVDHDAFHPRWRSRPPTAEIDVVRVGYVGRLAAEKRVERMAHTLGLPHVEVVIVGDGDRRPHLEAALPGATFTGRLGGDDLSRAFADLDVFVHTGAHETFCQAAQEALASGVPVVAPAAGGLLDLVQHGENGLLWRPDRPQDIGTAVRTLAADPARRAALGRTAHERVQGRTWERLGDELIGHYLAAQHHHRTSAIRATA